MPESLAEIILKQDEKLYGEFRKELDQGIRKVEDKFTEDKLSLERTFNEHIDQDHIHRQVRSVCMHPFRDEKCQPFKLGYHFFRPSPLFELGLKNFDLLIYNHGKKKTAIFVEAKGSIYKASKTIKQTTGRKLVAEEQRDYILSEYLKPGKEPVRFEFVIAVPVEEHTDICEEIESQDVSLIPWSAGSFATRNVLSMKLPSKLDEKSRIRMRHHDKDLNVALEKGVRSEYSPYGMFPEDHEVTRLRGLVLASRNLEVSISRLEDVLKEYLVNLGEKTMSDLIWQTIDRGIEIGVLRKIDKSTFKIVAGAKQREKVERIVIEKWMKYTLENELEKRMKHTEEELLTKYLKQFKKQTQLDEYETFIKNH